MKSEESTIYLHYGGTCVIGFRYLGYYTVFLHCILEPSLLRAVIIRSTEMRRAMKPLHEDNNPNLWFEIWFKLGVGQCLSDLRNFQLLEVAHFCLSLVGLWILCALVLRLIFMIHWRSFALQESKKGPLGSGGDGLWPWGTDRVKRKESCCAVAVSAYRTLIIAIPVGSLARDEERHREGQSANVIYSWGTIDNSFHYSPTKVPLVPTY